MLKKTVLTTVEWVGFKLTFLEKDICHDHEIDILRSLTTLQLRYVKKNMLFQQILIAIGVLSIKSIFCIFLGQT